MPYYVGYGVIQGNMVIRQLVIIVIIKKNNDLGEYFKKIVIFNQFFKKIKQNQEKCSCRN